jgi:hypothetical protein
VHVIIERTSPWSLQGRLAGAATPRTASDRPTSERPARLAALQPRAERP